MKKSIYDAVLFFKFLRVEHLKKDIGFIDEAYRSSGKKLNLSGFENNSTLDSRVTYLPGHFGQKLAALKTIFFVLKLRRKTNRLILIHISRENILLAFLFGFISNKKTYIKSDMNIDGFLRNDNSFWAKNKIIDPIIKAIAVRYIDKISVETQLGKGLIDGFFNRRIKTFYLPNSSNLSPIKECDISKKEDRVLYVGRLGCPHKNVELILDALSEIKSCPFHFDFVGPITDDFKSLIDGFNKNDQLDVEFHGPVYDEMKLRMLYTRAKYLILSSRSEGFPLVFPEALASGCTIISSDVYAAKDVVLSSQFIFSSKQQLCSILKNLPTTDSESLNIKSLAKYQDFERGKLIKIFSEEIIHEWHL